VDLHGARAVLGRCTHGDLHPYATLLGHHQRCLDHQLFQDTAAGLVTGPDSQFDESGAREERHAADRVIGEPGMRFQRQA
jgi:hypothetical protein